jgi:hypothetical protein
MRRRKARRFGAKDLSLLRRSQLAVIIALLLAGSMWFYVQRILIPYQKADAAARGRPRGNLSDLYPRWLGTRELLLNHRDPYSPQVTREIQLGYYGRLLDPSRSDDPKDQQAFAYPVYVAFLLAPTVGLRFDTVEAVFRWFLVAVTAASVLLWLHALHWRPAATTTAILLILTLGSFPAAQGIKLQQLTLLVSGFLASCAALLASGYLFAAGILLALATIKPQLAAPLSAWLIFWTMWDWRRRQRLFWGFALTMALLLGGAHLILPGWLNRFRSALSAYRQYAGAASLLDVLVTPAWGTAVSVVILLALAAACWRLGRVAAFAEAFALTLALTLAVTVVVIPMFAPYNQLLLLPGVLLALRWSRRLWQKRGLPRLIIMVSVLLLGWPWLATLALMLVSKWLPSAAVQRAWAIPLYTSLEIPLAILALLALLALDGPRPGKAAAASQGITG